MVRSLLFVLVTTLLTTTCAQSNRSKPIVPDMASIYQQHGKFREPLIQDRRFKHADIEPIIQALPGAFRVQVAGRSNEGRAIYRVTIGNGPVKVLLWSQMHGDESTATMALFDIFRFFQSNDEFGELRQRILDNLTVHFVPMLNPDGAERFTRRNTQDIDINRDAQRLATPEGRTLKALRDSIDADWGFNLHDQSRYYAVGNTPNMASISFLAPAYNEAKSMNEKRADATQLICLMNAVLQNVIPGKVGRYDDTFEPRAFGDNIQKWGTRTILIETGGLDQDTEKQELRRMNFIAILAALGSIADGSYETHDIAAYETIPFNNSGAFYDLVLRDVDMPGRRGKLYPVDLGFRRGEVPKDDQRTYYHRASLAELGDLSTFFGYQDVPLKGYQAKPGRVYPQVFRTVAELSTLNPLELLRQGYTDVQVEQHNPTLETTNLPLMIVPPGTRDSAAVRLGTNTSILLDKNGETHYAVINGRLFDLRKGSDELQLLMRTTAQ